MKLRRMPISDQAADALRSQIVSRELTPGQVVTEEASARLLGISRPTLRQALATLEAEGLLTRNPTSRVLQVPSLTADDVAEIYRARRVLEFAGVDAASSVQAERLDRLWELLKSIEHAVRKDDLSLQVETDYEMHEAIVSFLDSPHLSTLETQLLRRLRLAVVTDRQKDPRATAMLQDNRLLCQLLTTRQTAEARAVLSRRLAAAERSIIDCLEPLQRDL